MDGEGIRFVVFTQGCPHHCPGCHNPQTHPFEGGFLGDIPALLRQMGENPLLQGLTISGGEPFCQPEALLPLARGAREQGKDVTIFWKWPKIIRLFWIFSAPATFWWTAPM